MAFTPIINTTLIKANIAAFIQAVTGQAGQGLPFTWKIEWQPAVKPLKPYAVFKITGPRKIGGLDEIRATQLVDNQNNPIFDNEENPVFGEYDKSGEREFTVSIECASNDETATELVTNLLAALEQPQFVSLLETGGCSVRGILGVQDMTTLLADITKYERRVILEFYFIAPSIALYDAGFIKEMMAQITASPAMGPELEISLDVKAQ